MRPHLRGCNESQATLRLSIIIPALNESTSIAATIDSVRTAVVQPVDVLVVDGGSSDDTVQKAQSLGATVVPSERGRGRQLNAGWRAARGDWCLFLHSDSQLPPKYDVAIASCIHRASLSPSSLPHSHNNRRSGIGWAAARLLAFGSKTNRGSGLGGISHSCSTAENNALPSSSFSSNGISSTLVHFPGDLPSMSSKSDEARAGLAKPACFDQNGCCPIVSSTTADGGSSRGVHPPRHWATCHRSRASTFPLQLTHIIPGPVADKGAPHTNIAPSLLCKSSPSQTQQTWSSTSSAARFPSYENQADVGSSCRRDVEQCDRYVVPGHDVSVRSENPVVAGTCTTCVGAAASADYGSPGAHSCGVVAHGGSAPVWGAFATIDTDLKSPILRTLLSAGVEARTRFCWRPYGDQALFVRRDVLQACGGFQEWPLLEDLDLVLRLGKEHRPVIVDGAVRTSGRRWQSLGFLRTTFTNQVILLAYALGVSPGTLAKWYRGPRQRSGAPTASA